MARDELPHSIGVTGELLEVAPGEDPDVLRVRVVIRVERDSQKGIVIGKGGAVLRDAGTRAREELEALLGIRVYLETQGPGRPGLAAQGEPRSTASACEPRDRRHKLRIREGAAIESPRHRDELAGRAVECGMRSRSGSRGLDTRNAQDE